MYVCLPPCLRCSNSCVCFSLLPPPSLDYHCERKHAAHRALQSSGGGRAKVNPMWGQGLAATTITTWLWGAGGPQGGGDRAGATVAAFGWSADAPTVVSRGGGLSVLLLSSVFSPEHLHSNEEIWAFSCFSARSCHVFPLPKRVLVVVYCNFFPPPLPCSRCCWCSVTCSLQPPQSCTVHPAPLWGAPSHPCAWGSPGWVTWGGHCSQEDVVLLAKDAAITPTLGTPPCRVLTGPLLACTVLWFGSQTPPAGIFAAVSCAARAQRRA